MPAKIVHPISRLLLHQLGEEAAKMERSFHEVDIPALLIDLLDLYRELPTSPHFAHLAQQQTADQALIRDHCFRCGKTLLNELLKSNGVNNITNMLYRLHHRIPSSSYLFVLIDKLSDCLISGFKDTYV